MEKVLVTGAGGFIGGHLVKRLKEEGYWVRGVDIKEPEYRKSEADQFDVLDLRSSRNCADTLEGIDAVFNLAADMGGIGYIGTVQASISRNNVLINTNMLEESKSAGVQKFFFSSSACIYPSFKQRDGDLPLKETDAIPADPEPGYGWEKLFTEQLCKYYRRDYGLDTKVARFHNIYGPYGTYQGGREKAPAAICRKVAEAKDTIQIWGDGEQTRTFTYIDDCIEGIIRLMKSRHSGPFNIGSDEVVTINQMVDMVCGIAGKKLNKTYDLTQPQGVRGRSSDNTLIWQKLGWEPSTKLYDGLKTTYEWIAKELQCA